MSDIATESVKLQEILSSIITATFGISITNDMFLADQFDNADWGQKLSRAINEELGVRILPEEVASAGSLLQLVKVVSSHETKNPKSQSIVDIYAKLEQLVREELHPNIDYNWYANWTDFYAAGNWLTKPDGLDYVELVMRIEAEFGFGISNQDAQAMQTVGQTVRYLWRRSCEQVFALRRQSENVCPSAFIFHELRRLLIIRGGVPRNLIHLDSRLGELLPSWHTQFWKQVQIIFHTNLPHSHLLAFTGRVEKRTTVRELVNMVAPSQDTRDSASAP